MFLAACGSASADRPPVTTTSTTSTTSTTFVAALPDLPADPEEARCQAIVNALVSEWQPLGRVEAEIRCLPPIDGEGGHYQPGARNAVVGARTGTSDGFYRAVAVHELGHAWEDWHFDDADYRAYEKIRGFDFDAEDYADVFAIAFGEVAAVSAIVAPVSPELIALLRAEGLLPG